MLEQAGAALRMRLLAFCVLGVEPGPARSFTIDPASMFNNLDRLTVAELVA